MVESGGNRGGASNRGISTNRYRSILERFETWAIGESTVRAVLIVGSQARPLVPADAGSDLDLVVFSSDPEGLLSSEEWVRRFGPVELTFVEPSAVGGGRERRVLYSEGRDVDFSVFPAQAVELLPQIPEALEVLRRGFRILLDKDGNLARATRAAPSAETAADAPPTAKDFRQCVDDFWYHVLWAAKKLRRGELWTAKSACDGHLKRLLLQMVAWRTRFETGGRADTWHDGRFIDQWAPRDFLERLPETFARYESADIARALDRTGRLFSETARRVASAARLGYPAETEKHVAAQVKATLEGRRTSPTS